MHRKNHKKQNIFLLIQDKQHYLKLRDLLPLLQDEHNVTFVIHNYDLEKHFQLNTRFTYLKVRNDIIKLEPTNQNYGFMYLSHQISTKIAEVIPLRYLKPLKVINTLFLYIPILRRYLNKLIMRILKANADNINNAVNDLFSHHKCDILLMAEANVGYFSELFITAAHNIKAKVIIIPYTICGPSEPAKHYYNNHLHQAQPGDEEVLDKKWLYNYQGRTLLRMPKEFILVMEKLGISPKTPWVQDSSTADYLIAESAMVAKHYMKYGIKRSQIQIIGDINHDVLFGCLSVRDNLKYNICAEAGLDATKKIVLFGIVADYTAIHPDTCEFDNYHNMLQYICYQLSSINNANVLLCVHPSLNPKQFTFLESSNTNSQIKQCKERGAMPINIGERRVDDAMVKNGNWYNIKLSTRPTAELLSIADLYVTTVSSTIKWAISIGLPVINYDMYKFRYGDYLEAPGVLNIETKKEFEKIIADINNDEAYLISLAKKQKAIKNDWGVIDGKFHERFKQLIKGQKI